MVEGVLEDQKAELARLGDCPGEIGLLGLETSLFGAGTGLLVGSSVENIERNEQPHAKGGREDWRLVAGALCHGGSQHYFYWSDINGFCSVVFPELVFPEVFPDTVSYRPQRRDTLTCIMPKKKEQPPQLPASAVLPSPGSRAPEASLPCSMATTSWRKGRR